MATCIICKKSPLLKHDCWEYQPWGVAIHFCSKCLESLTYRVVVVCQTHELYLVPTDRTPKYAENGTLLLRFAKHCIFCECSLLPKP